jgi:hypothetical protein
LTGRFTKIWLGIGTHLVWVGRLERSLLQ